MSDRVLRFPATLAAYARTLGELQAVLDERGIRGRGRYNVELVFEEIVGNIIRHGRAGEGGGAIEVSLGFESHGVVMRFHDDGPPFDPRGHGVAERPRSIDDARVGGLGLLLVRNASTRIDYERTLQARNQLTVTVATALSGG